MPSHYPHWSYGKSYEKLKTLYDYGVSGLPYEMVINSNPALAYLMRDNSLLPADPDHRARLRAQRLLQEQLHLPDRRAPSSRIGTFKAHAERVRSLRRGPEHRLRARSSTSSTPPTRCRSSAGATWRCRSSRRRRSASGCCDAATPPRRSVPAHPPPRGVRRARSAKRTPLVARGGPAALHPRPQPVPHRLGDATCSPSCTRRRSTSSRRSRPRS